MDWIGIYVYVRRYLYLDKWPIAPSKTCGHSLCRVKVYHLCQLDWEVRNGYKETTILRCQFHYPRSLPPKPYDGNFVGSCNYHVGDTCHCSNPTLPLKNCAHGLCRVTVHHLCQLEWEVQNGYEETTILRCQYHHPRSSSLTFRCLLNLLYQILNLVTSVLPLPQQGWNLILSQFHL